MREPGSEIICVRPPSSRVTRSCFLNRSRSAGLRSALRLSELPFRPSRRSSRSYTARRLRLASGAGDAADFGDGGASTDDGALLEERALSGFTSAGMGRILVRGFTSPSFCLVSIAGFADLAGLADAGGDPAFLSFEAFLSGLTSRGMGRMLVLGFTSPSVLPTGAPDVDGAFTAGALPGSWRTGRLASRDGGAACASCIMALAALCGRRSASAGADAGSSSASAVKAVAVLAFGT